MIIEFNDVSLKKLKLMSAQLQLTPVQTVKSALAMLALIADHWESEGTLVFRQKDGTEEIFDKNKI